MGKITNITPTHTALIKENDTTRLVEGWAVLKGVTATIVPRVREESTAAQQYEFVSTEVDYKHPAYSGEGHDGAKLYVFCPKRYNDFVLLSPEEVEKYKTEQQTTGDNNESGNN